MGDRDHEFIIRTAVNISPAVIWEFVPDVCCSIDLWKLLPQPQVSVTDGAASGLHGLVLVPSGAGGVQAQQQRSFLLSASPALERSLQIWPLHLRSHSSSLLFFLSRASSHPRPAALPGVSLQQREVAAASLSLLHPTDCAHRPHPGASAAQVIWGGHAIISCLLLKYSTFCLSVCLPDR